jgi:hypothetical protein
MTTALVLTNLIFAAAIVSGLAAVCRLGHRLGSGDRDHRVLSLPRREDAAAAKREAA